MQTMQYPHRCSLYARNTVRIATLRVSAKDSLLQVILEISNIVRVDCQARSCASTVVGGTGILTSSALCGSRLPREMHHRESVQMTYYISPSGFAERVATPNLAPTGAPR